MIIKRYAVTASVCAAAAAAADQNSIATKLAGAYADGLAALMKGDASTYMTRIGGFSPDFVLMAPMGGEPSRAIDYSPERIERMGRFFSNGSFDQEIVASYAVRDMIVLATIERAKVEVGGLPSQQWDLRVTSVFVRRGTDWTLAHRHADPLVADVPLTQAARLARGERSAVEG